MVFGQVVLGRVDNILLHATSLLIASLLIASSLIAPLIHPIGFLQGRQ